MEPTPLRVAAPLFVRPLLSEHKLSRPVIDRFDDAQDRVHYRLLEVGRAALGATPGGHCAELEIIALPVHVEGRRGEPDLAVGVHAHD
jgi:hypothetical protein